MPGRSYRAALLLVIKLEDVRPVQVPPLDQVKQQVAESLQQKKLAEFRESLMKKAKIQ